MSDFNELLDQAEKGSAAALTEFYKKLLRSEVFVPISPAPLKEEYLQHIKSGDSFVIIPHHGDIIVPIFSDENVAKEWGGDATDGVYKLFRSFVHLLGEDVTLHFNPGQDLGKDISPWEVEKLKSGVDAIPEIIADVMGGEAVTLEIDVDSSSELYPELKKKLIIALEAYVQIEEAFLVSIKEKPDQAEPSAMLGIRHDGLPEDKQKLIEEEAVVMAEVSNETAQPLQVAFDLAAKNSATKAIFEEATPFYIAQRLVGKDTGSIISKIKKALK